MPIDPLTLMMLTMAFFLITLLLLAGIYDLRTSKHKKSKDETVYRCSDCERTFTYVHRTPLARCPTCGKQNAPPR
jgi:rRNA maturation endonuclease Nob1